MARRWIALLALLWSLIGVTTTGSEATVTYDLPAVARVDAHEFEVAGTSPARLSGSRKGSASPPLEARGTTRTPSLAFIATEAGLPPLRQAYVDDVAAISDNVAAWEKAGADPEFIAREAWADRRALGIEYKGQTPQDVLDQITARNVSKYGDPLGPTIDWLRAQGKTWQQIIESATRPGGQDFGF